MGSKDLVLENKKIDKSFAFHQLGLLKIMMAKTSNAEIYR